MADNSAYLTVSGASPRALRLRITRRAKNLRLSAGRSQADLARASGTSLPTLRRFESGANVSVDVLLRVAIALGAEHEFAEAFPLPDPRTIEEVIQNRRLPQRGRSR